MKKSIVCLFLAVCIAVTVSLSGCSDKEPTSDTSSKTSSATGTQNNSQTASQNDSTEVIKMDQNFNQFDLPQNGEEVAVLHTNMGDIYIRLFPQYAPKTVENFKGLINQKYYDGIIFHRVINDFMIQGGDPTGTGRGGESLWGGKFEDEFTANVFNFRGSLAMANAGPNTNGSQFFINQAKPDEGATGAMIKSQLQMYGYKTNVDDKVFENYAQKGGNFHLDGVLSPNGRGHTVFGQVYEGMDVVDAIANVQVGVGDKPVNTVKIETAEIIKYSK